MVFVLTSVICHHHGREIMRQVIAIAVVAAALSAPTAAGAGERVFDGALGAASGALVGGPVGFIAGGAVGFFAGPHISRGLGFHRHYRHGSYGRHASAPRNEREARSESR
jgi:hypothetical protein